MEFGKAGATFIELYTAFAYKGPGLVGKIRDELAEELRKEGKTWEQIIGSDDKWTILLWYVSACIFAKFFYNCIREKEKTYFSSC